MRAAMSNMLTTPLWEHPLRHLSRCRGSKVDAVHGHGVGRLHLLTLAGISYCNLILEFEMGQQRRHVDSLRRKPPLE